MGSLGEQLIGSASKKPARKIPWRRTGLRDFLDRIQIKE